MPFQISCGSCWMCDRGLYTPCETTQVRDQGMGAVLFGFSKLYGEVDGGQAELLRVPQAQFTHIKVPEGPADEPPEPWCRLSAAVMSRVGLDRLAAVHTAIDAVRRGGTVSLIGVYGGMSDPMPLMTMFDKQIQMRMGQANVKRWVDDIMPLLVDDADPLGTEQFATHTLPLSEAPWAYDAFQKKTDGAVKVVFKP